MTDYHPIRQIGDQQEPIMTNRVASTGLPRRGFLAGTIATLAFAAGLKFPTEARADAAAEAFVKKVGGQVLNVAKNGGSKASKSQQIQKLLASHADVPALAVFSLGQFAKQLPSSRRTEYYNLVKRYIARMFVNHSDSLAGDSLQIDSSRDVSAKEALVRSKVTFANGRTLPVVWRLSKRGGYKVFDVNIDGVWLAIQQRSEFVSIINSNNGDVNALIDHLKQVS